MFDGLFHWFSTLLRYSNVLYGAFYSGHLYAHVVKRWRGLGLGYLLFLVALGAIPLSARVIIAFNHFFNQKILFPIQSLPPLTIKNGAITFHHSMPYVIKNQNGEVVTLIDTTGAVSEIGPSYPQLAVLITKNKMILRPPSYKQFLGLVTDNTGNPSYTHTFGSGVNGFFSGAQWIKSTGIRTLNRVINILTYPCIMFFYFSFFGIMVLLLSALVQVYSDVFFSVTLPFKASCRLLTVAATPGLILFFFIRSCCIAVPGIGLVFGVLFLSSISYGLYSAKQLGHFIDANGA